MTTRLNVCLLVAAFTALTPAKSSADARKWYLAEGASTPFFDEQIPIANPNSVPTNCVISFLKTDGSVILHTLQVPAASRRTVHLDTIPALDNSAVSAVVECDLEVVAERTMYFTATNRLGGHNANGVLEPALKWHLAEGATGFYDDFILIANTSPTSDVQARITFLRNDGTAPVIRNYVVARNSRFTVWVNEHVPELTATAFSAVVESLNGAPIIVERSMYWNNFKGGHATAGITAPSTLWRFAEGFAGAGFQTFLLLGNPSATDSVNARVTFFLETGEPIVQDYVVGPTTRLDVWTNMVPGLDDQAFSMVVESLNGVALVSERAVYFNNFSDGHVTVGLTAESTRWGFAEGLERGHFGTYFKTFYLFANASVIPAEIKATFYREDGAGIVRTFTIAPQSRRTIWAADYLELTNQRFAAFFEATNGVTFLAERAVYWDDSFYAGHASPGTPWPQPSAISAPAKTPPPATVTSVSPAIGPTNGGTEVTIIGTNFASDATVSFGGIAGTVLGVVDASRILARTPSHTAGVVDLSVTSNSATTTLAGAFTFVSTQPPPPPPTTPVTYNFDAGVSGTERDTIEAGVSRALSYFVATFGETVQNRLTVTVRATNGPTTAAANDHALTIYTGHEGWLIVGHAQRTKIVIHEVFHILQTEVGWPSALGGWLHEGSAEYVGYASIIDGGLASYDEVRNCQIGNYFGADGPSAPPLEQISFSANSPTRGRYIIAWLAWDRLLHGLGGVHRIDDYWRAGFAAAFGLSEAMFYQDFAQYRAGLQPTTTNVCAGLNTR